MACGANAKWWCVELAAVAYSQAWDLQRALVRARERGVVQNNIVLLLEHPPVFTLGRRGGLGSLRVSIDVLKKVGIEVIHVERGGDVTFHGPGQLVMYPIIDLHKLRIGVNDYVEALEEVMVRVARDWGIEAGRSSKNRGTWVSGRKLGSIGIAVRKGITFHGMALNVNLELGPFQWIKPCGLAGVEMTSMAQETFGELPMDQVRERVKVRVEEVFNVGLDMAGLGEIEALLRDPDYFDISKRLAL